jgi:hypothetical protein
MTAEIIQQLVAPVVMISACGLLFMALNVRLVSILNRLRSFHRERMDIYVKISEAQGGGIQAYHHRYDGLEKQTRRLLQRAAITRNGLISVSAGVACFLICSIALGLSGPFPSVAPVAVGLFVLGILFMLGAVILATRELWVCLELARFEHESLESLEHTMESQEAEERAHQDPI